MLVSVIEGEMITEDEGRILLQSPQLNLLISSVQCGASQKNVLQILKLDTSIEEYRALQ